MPHDSFPTQADIVFLRFGTALSENESSSKKIFVRLVANIVMLGDSQHIPDIGDSAKVEKELS
jgi:hypothetical protein